MMYQIALVTEAIHSIAMIGVRLDGGEAAISHHAAVKPGIAGLEIAASYPA